MLVDYYYYHRLSNSNKGLYKKLYKGVIAFEESIFVSGMFTEKDVSKVFTAIILDNPFIYHIDVEQYHILTIPLVGITVTPKYLYTKQKCELINEKIKKYTQAIITKAGVQSGTVAEQIKGLHDYLATNIMYDFDSLTLRKHSTARNNAHTILGVFLSKKAVCDGIAKAFKYLLNVMGIKCIVVIGTCAINNNMAFTENHAWNIVKINDDSYHIDLTGDTQEVQNGHAGYSYYCLSDVLIHRDHSDFNAPLCSADSENYFLRSNSIINSYDELIEYLRININISGDIYVRIEFEVGEDFDRYVIELIQKERLINRGRNKISIIYNNRQKTLHLSLQ